jgi:MurNAc alpha-1-phosphate uridylyltransferase
VIVKVHHFADQIIDVVKRNDGWGSNIVISDETTEVLETGGGLLKAKDLFKHGERVITCNVDILTDLDLNKLIAFHEKYKPLISFAVTNRKTSRYFLFDEKGRLCGWRNTKTGEERIVIPKSGLIEKAYSCVVVFEPEIFSLIPFRGKFSLVDVYLKLAADHLILGYDHTGDRFVDVGKPESIAIAESLFP